MSKRILVVEDTLDNREIMRDMLDAAGYVMIEAVNGSNVGNIASQKYFHQAIHYPFYTVVNVGSGNVAKQFS